MICRVVRAVRVLGAGLGFPVGGTFGFTPPTSDTVYYRCVITYVIAYVTTCVITHVIAYVIAYVITHVTYTTKLKLDKEVGGGVLRK